jgi:PhoH-like ATPase
LKKTYVLDTNVILDDARILDKLEGKVVIPFQVLEEIDLHKKDKNETGANARYFARLMNEISKAGDLFAGVKHGPVEVFAYALSDKVQDKMASLKLEDIPDNRIIASALCFKSSILLSNDITLRLKAGTLGQKCDVHNKSLRADSIDEVYSGMCEVEVLPEDINELYAEGKLGTKKKLVNNQFVLVKSSVDSKHTAIAKYRDGVLHKLVEKKGVSGIRPRNLKQSMCMDALMDPSIDLITILGPAGAGKTLLSLAAALDQALGSAPKYDKIILMKAPVPVGLDVGFLPGNLLEKILPHFQSFLDNLEILMPQAEKSTLTFLTHLMEIGKLEMLPPTYIRGRSLPNTFIICDEAQNLTREEIKTIATRVGEGSKLVMMGDIYQIDRQGLDFSNNGLTHLVETFKGQACASHITMTKGERSTFAELAADIL